MKPIRLNVDGANPLGFLAAVGLVRLLSEKKGERGAPDVRLSWTESRRPVVLAQGVEDGAALVGLIADLASRPAPDATAVEAEKAARSFFEEARRKERKKREEIRKRRLPRDKRKEAMEAEHAPLATATAGLRSGWRIARAKAAPDVTVSMGLDLNVKSEEFIEHCRDALDASTSTSRRWVDFCACFGTESANERMDATPFALISGSGHQHFLGTAGDLMVACAADHFGRALLNTWAATDDGSSFRWDPDDDRRYALLADDPTASGNKPKTIWGANRLAFEALRLFPCVRARTGPATVGWRHAGESDVWRWPLWAGNLSPAVISSILASGDIWRDDPESRRRLRARGVFAVFQTRRIAVGRAPNQKLNFTPAVPVWSTGTGRSSSSATR
jgi:hypothetical protein